MIEVYSKNNCQQCRMVKNFLASKSVEFIEINTSDNQEAIKMLKNLGVRSLPAVFENNELKFTGFAPTELQKLKGVSNGN